MLKSLSGAAILLIALSGMYLAGTAGYGGLAKWLFDFYSLRPDMTLIVASKTLSNCLYENCPFNGLMKKH